MTNYSKIDSYLETYLENSIKELVTLCAQPSVAAQNLGLTECADLVAQMLRRRGFNVEVVKTEGAPIVFAEREGRTNKTLLFYDHYDVQPAEPFDLWESPPFTPTLRDGKLYARGVSDNKGHIVSRLHALDALHSVDGEFPCKVKFLIEGEEETSSTHLHSFAESHKDVLSADACIWEFGGVDFHDVPQLYLGVRGICYVELSVETAIIDSHSGLGGTIFPNAAWRLVWALNTLKTPDEHIRLPGHYDQVKKPTRRDHELMSKLPDIAEDLQKQYGIKNFIKGISGGVELRMAEVFEPSCTICGLTSGYQEAGSKTVLPARASAKLDFRLVPDQTPEQVLSSLREHLDKEGFSDVKITNLGGERPSRTDPDEPFVQLVARTAEPIYAHPMQIVPMVGGSGPNYVIANLLNVPIATAGVGYPGAQAHAPNENLRLDLYLKGAKHITRILKAFSETNNKK